MARSPTGYKLHGGALAASVSLVLLAQAATPAMAAPAPKPVGFALSPVSDGGGFLLRGKPGRTMRRAVLLRNLTGRAVTVRVQAADIRTATNGNADYVTPRRAGSGRWVRLAARSVRLAPRATRRVGFTVRIPDSARGGSHYAGIVAIDMADLRRAGRKPAKGQKVDLRHINRQALPMTIRLPGRLTRRLTLRALKLDTPAAGPALVFGLLPGGTTLIERAQIRFRVLRGARTLFEHSGELGQLFPREPLALRVPWEGALKRGSYRIRGVIRPQGARAIVIDRTVRFTPAALVSTSKAVKAEVEGPLGRPAFATTPGLPVWVWIALSGGVAALLAVLILLVLLRRRTSHAAA